MNIAVMMWEISKVGGVKTFHNNLVQGLRSCGNFVDSYFISLNKEFTKKESEDKGNEGMKRILFRGRHLVNFLEEMKKYDLMIFSTPCPYHVEFTDESWIECYNKPVAKKVAVFHDSLGENHYDWIRRAKIDYCVAVQPKALISSMFYDNGRKGNAIICNHPLDVSKMIEPDIKLKSLQKQFIVHHQFKTWKRIDWIVRSIPLTTLDMKVKVFNKGTEYYYMRRASYPYLEDEGRKPSKATKLLRQALAGDEAAKHTMIWSKYQEYGSMWKDAIDSGKMEYLGMSPFEVLHKTLRESHGAIDMSEAGESSKKYLKIYPNLTSINYSVLESALFGTVPIVRKWAVQEPFKAEDFLLVKEGAIPSQYLPINLSMTLDSFDYSQHIEKIKHCQEILKKHYDRKLVAKKILDFVEGKIEPIDGNKILGRKFVSSSLSNWMM